MHIYIYICIYLYICVWVSISILYYNILYYLIHFTMQNLPLLEFLEEAFRCYVHQLQCLRVGGTAVTVKNHLNSYI